MGLISGDLKINGTSQTNNRLLPVQSNSWPLEMSYCLNAYIYFQFNMLNCNTELDHRYLLYFLMLITIGNNVGLVAVLLLEIGSLF